VRIPACKQIALLGDVPYQQQSDWQTFAEEQVYWCPGLEFRHLTLEFNYAMLRANSGAEEQQFIRPPADVINLVQVLGFSQANATRAVRENTLAVLKHAGRILPTLCSISSML
jgi:hypothetical protein